MLYSTRHKFAYVNRLIKPFLHEWKIDSLWLFASISSLPHFQRIYYLPLYCDFVLRAGLETWPTNEAKLNLIPNKIPILPLCECKILFQYRICKFNSCGQTAGDSVRRLCTLTQWTPSSSRKLSVATVMWATNSNRTNSLLSENN
jgi:hypothetical protein